MSAVPVVARSEWTETVRAETAGAPRDAHIQLVRWNFFETFGMPLVSGRSLQAADTSGAPRVAVINAAMARQVFAENSPARAAFPVRGRAWPRQADPRGRCRARCDVLEAQRASAGHVFHALHADTVGTDDVRSPNRWRFARLTPSIRAAIHRIDPGPSTDRRAHPGRADRPDHPRPASLRRIECGVWSDRTAAGLHRTLRRRVLRCAATHE